MLEIMMQSDEGSIVLFCSILFIFLLLFLLLLFQFIFRLHIVDLSVFKTQLHLLWIEFHFESWLNSTYSINFSFLC